MPEQIKPVRVSTSYEQDMVAYSIMVNRRRALPEDRDGLKPVQRYILIDMNAQNATSFAKRIKSSAIVGDAMKLYYGHGDSSIYGAMEPIANWYSCKIPLLAPKGNWGTLLGDSPAAMRYTETGLSDFCFECVIGDLREHKNAVDWIPNYSRTTMQPEYLPVKVPLLMILGTFGIGVGLSVDIPTFNLNEVIDVTRNLIHHPNADVVLIPDHCQPCEIIDTDWKKISDTGEGSYRVRGIVEIGEVKEKKETYPALFIKSLPNGVTTKVVTDALYKMIESKQLPMIKDINDETKNKVDITIVLKKGTDPYYVREVLYVKTKVQDNCSVNFEVVHGLNPKRMGYKEYLFNFIKQRKETKFRIYCNKMQAAMTRFHELDAYIKFMKSGEIDNIYNMIRKQKNIGDTELVEYMIKKCGITDIQSKYILNSNFKKFAIGYLPQYEAEYKALYKEQQMCEAAITDPNVIIDEIDQELQDIRKKYGSPRLCKVISASEGNSVPKGIFKVVVTDKNYIRKVPDTDKIGAVKRDNPKFILRVDNTESILLFDNKGKVFRLPVAKIPITDRNYPGTDVRVLIKNLTSDIISVYYEPIIKKIVESTRTHYLTMVTKHNSIKRLELEDFTTVNASGLMYAKLADGDEVAGIAVNPIDLDVVVYSDHKALRVPTKKVPLFKRNAAGSKAMNTNDPVEGISVIYPDTDLIVVITKNGYINKFNASGLSVSDRAKAGSSVIRLDKTDSIFAIYGVSDKDKIHIVTSDSITDINVSDVKLYSSVAKGTKMISTVSTNIVRVDIIKG